MTINEYSLKLTGKANIPQPLKLGFSYDLEIKNAEIRKSEQVPNDDGTMDEIYKLEISELSEVVLKSGEKQMKATKKGSQSKLQRWLIQQIAEGKGLDPDKYYQERMDENIKNLKLELEV